VIHSKVTVVFCGEEHSVSPDTGLTIGRSGDLEIDDNPYLHRTFLVVSFDNGFWWLSNTGSTLTATVADEQGLFQAWLSPGARIPLAMKTLIVWFTAGPTTYDFEIHVASPVFQSVTSDLPEAGVGGPGDDAGAATVGRVSLTPDQRLLVVALCEPFLLRREAGTSQIPSSAAAAERLGWTLTRFNRKLDNVCQKLADAGTRGLHGGVGKLATNRKARLVEHALSTKLVSEDDLVLLGAPDVTTASTTSATSATSTASTASTVSTASTASTEKVAGTPVVAAEQGTP
jgi:hypothetical protein